MLSEEKIEEKYGRYMELFALTQNDRFLDKATVLAEVLEKTTEEHEDLLNRFAKSYGKNAITEEKMMKNQQTH